MSSLFLPEGILLMPTDGSLLMPTNYSFLTLAINMTALRKSSNTARELKEGRLSNRVDSLLGGTEL
jgi:hypothetical protein